MGYRHTGRQHSVVAVERVVGEVGGPTGHDASSDHEVSEVDAVSKEDVMLEVHQVGNYLVDATDLTVRPDVGTSQAKPDRPEPAATPQVANGLQHRRLHVGPNTSPRVP